MPQHRPPGAGEGMVDVYVTSYALGDLTIGKKQ